jgi:glucokinase
VQSPADITARALRADCPRCAQAVDLFLDIVGAEAGAMALRLMATGGVYVAGGILPRILPKVEGDETLGNAFLNIRSRFSTVLQRFPLFVLKREAGLAGVFHYAVALAQGRR